MKQVVQSARTGKLAVRDVPVPKAAAGELLVRTRTSLISAGTERMVVDFAKKSLASKAKARPDLVQKVMNKMRTDGLKATFKAVMSRLDEPLPLGYSAAGVVVDVGPGLEGAYRVGDRVAVAGAGLANHAELNAVPRNLATPIPADVTDEEACYGTLAAIALHAVRNLDAKLGETVAVLGLGLVGQLAAQFLALSGVRVVALDYDQSRLDLAQNLGVEKGINLTDRDAAAQTLTFTSGRGCDGILIAAATDSSEPFETAAEIARDRAKVCLVGLSGTEFPYAAFMKKEMSIVVSRSYGPGRYDEDFEGRDVKYPDGFVRWTETENLGESVRLMSSGLSHRLNVSDLTTHRYAIEEAEQAYALVMEKTEPHLGVLLTYPDTVPAKEPVQFPEPHAAGGSCVVGLIGAGQFARAVLLPELGRQSDVKLHTLVSKGSASAGHSGEKFGFEVTSTDDGEILNNPAINAVIIASRHDAHASQTVAALDAGKSVLVEKPLGLSRAEIEMVQAAREQSAGFFQVGFNRRFAPLSEKTKELLSSLSGPKLMTFRINAGPVAADSWLHNVDEGGGRIIGEMCHFVDLARYFAGSPIQSVMADAPRSNAGACDDVTATFRFEDGTLATITYTALGDTAHAKEMYEIFAGGSVIALDNFRALTKTSDGRTTTETGSQDKGFGAALTAFTKAVRSGGPAPIDEAELIETSLATLAILESLQSGARVDL